MTAEIITFRPRSDAPVRPAYLRDKHVRAALGLDADGGIARAAKAAADELAGGRRQRAKVHPDRHLALADSVDDFAMRARALADECKSAGHLEHCCTLSDLADILELMSAEIEAETCR